MQPRFGKIIDVSGSTSELTVEQVERIAKMLRGNADEKRGLVAFVINPDRVGFDLRGCDQDRSPGEAFPQPSRCSCVAA